MGLLRRAYAVGAVLGVIPLALDCLSRRAPFNVRTVAGFSRVGGSVAALMAWGLHALLRAARSRTPAIFSFAVFLSLEVLYLVKISLLPGSRFYELKCLGWAVVTLVVAVGGAWAASRTSRPLSKRSRHNLLPVAGGAFLTLGALQVGALWPAEPPLPRRVGTVPNLLVVVLESTRRDDLDIYGYERNTSPWVDPLAAQACVYDAALAASCWTLNSVPAMLGSRNGQPGESPVLEQLKARGYVAACFSDNPLFERQEHLVLDFDDIGHSTGAAPRALARLFSGAFVVDRVIIWPWLARSWDDGRLVDKVLAWAENRQGPVLLYVHLMDIHPPFRRPAIDGRTWRTRRLENPRTGMKLNPEEVSDVIAHYDGGTRSADAAVGRLLAAARLCVIRT